MKRMQFSILIFFVCLLLTTALWDHYLHSDRPFDRDLASYLILAMGLLFSVTAGLFTYSLESYRDRLEREVERKTAEIKTLRGFIPVCACCKKIRNVQGFWEQMESYFEKHSQATFTHGLCQNCTEKMKEKNAELIAAHKHPIKGTR